jgi:hypothetical protein
LRRAEEEGVRLAAALVRCLAEERRAEGRGAGYSMRIFDSEESGISVPKRTGKKTEYL